MLLNDKCICPNQIGGFLTYTKDPNHKLNTSTSQFYDAKCPFSPQLQMLQPTCRCMELYNEMLTFLNVHLDQSKSRIKM